MNTADFKDEDYPSDSKIIWGCMGVIGVFAGMMISLFIIYKVALLSL